jgi:glyoxylase-like metal-dependent hydrolase (beta-lactamase superfamily II)
MMLSKSEKHPFSLYSIETGRFKLDGGAMFGVVPKTLWSRHIEADEKNRINMAMRCLLIRSEATGRVYLIDTGSGHKFDGKFSSIYGFDYSHSTLEGSLKLQGFDPADITDIIFSHLHFDHCGGTTRYNAGGRLEHVFPNAKYWVTESHWETANHPNAREKSSFFAENLGPVSDPDRLNLISPGHVYEDGLSCLVMNGHTIGQQLPVVELNGKRLIFVADLIPTHVHIPLPWIMGYDMYPATTLEEKEEFLNSCTDGRTVLFFEHDADVEAGTVVREGSSYRIGEKLTLNDL